jgi:hypothetical protein
MAELSRRGFIKHTSIGAATVGALVTMPGLAAAHAASTEIEETSSTPSARQLVAFVRDASRGEVILMIDEREVIVHDRALVKRLLHAAQ